MWGRAQGSQIFKWNSIILICSKVMAFLVISLSPWSLWSPCCPRHPHVIPVISTLSPHHSRHPHIIPIPPRRSPCGPHGCGLRGLHPMLSPLSPSSPCRPHIIPIILTLFLHCLEGSHIIPNSPDTHSTHHPPPWGWGPQISKNAIRFELIEIF